VRLGEAAGETLRFGVDDEVDVPLAPERHILAAMACDWREAHGREQRAERLRIWRGVLDELEPVRPHRDRLGEHGRRRVVRKRARGETPCWPDGDTEPRSTDPVPADA